MRSRNLLISVAIVAASAGYLGGMLFPKKAHEVVPPGLNQVETIDATQAHRKVWVCPMHPQIVQDHPGTCPICGMQLVEAEGGANHHDEPSLVHVDNATQQKMGVRLASVQKIELSRHIDTYGTVTVAEDSIYQVTPNAEGQLTRLGVTAVGQKVSAGQLLYAIYSQELYQYQNEYVDFLIRERQALKSIEQTKEQNRRSLATVDPQNVALQEQIQRGISQSREQLLVMEQAVERDRVRVVEKLHYAGVTDKMLAALRQGGKALVVVPVFAKKPCLVTQIGARPGNAVNAMSPILTCADLSDVWIDVALYPGQLTWVRAGDAVTIRERGSPLEIHGKLLLPNPVIDPATQTVKGRIVIPNKDFGLMPGAIVDTAIRAHSRKVLAVPRSAVIRSGKGDYVMLSRGEGHFLPTPVETGIETPDWVELADSLQEGAQVAVNGHFLLDAAAALSDAVQRMQGKQ